MQTLLEQAGIHDELILVGHSAGGLYIRAFAGLYPREVAGLVFLEASSPELFHASPSRTRQELIAQRHREAPWLFFKVATGLARLTDDYCNPNTSQRIPALQDLARAEDCRPFYMNSWLQEWDDFEPSAEQVFTMPCCSSLPLVVISGDSVKNRQPVWDAVQEKLKSLSSRGMRFIARDSGHFVMVDRPDVVIAAVNVLDAEIHGQAGGIEPNRTIWR